MPLLHAVASLSCVGLILGLASAHTECTSCITLDDLLAEAYGIEISVDRLVSAVAFHNGTMVHIGALSTSQEYKDLLQPILVNETGLDTRRAAARCSKGPNRNNQSSFDQSFFSFLCACFAWLGRCWKSSQPLLNSLPAMSPHAQMFQAHIITLPPFMSMTAAERFKKVAAIQIPSWLTSSGEVCHIIEAAERIFGRVIIESPPSSAFAAAGYELCHVSYEAFICDGPGRLMTIEYNGDLAVASLQQTPQAHILVDPITYSVRKGLDSDGLAAWISDFIETEKPDKLIALGSNRDDPLLTTALEKSRARKYLEDTAHLSPKFILTMGAAQAAKGMLESQGTDCGESENCIQIRRKADAIAGEYEDTGPSPQHWPAWVLRRQHISREDVPEREL